jgi:hypothetical protein
LLRVNYAYSSTQRTRDFVVANTIRDDLSP